MPPLLAIAVGLVALVAGLLVTKGVRYCSRCRFPVERCHCGQAGYPPSED